MRAELSRVSHQTNISWECSRCGCSSPSTRDRLWEKWVRFGCITLKFHVLSIEKPLEEKSCPVLSGTAVLWTSYTTYSFIIWFRCKIFFPSQFPTKAMGACVGTGDAEAGSRCWLEGGNASFHGGHLRVQSVWESHSLRNCWYAGSRAVW